jgi:ATP-dependent DNA helicase RecQ
LLGNDTLALMPTGGGKSLCYQVPALAIDGLCLVISPLIALMKDQVESLRRKNITAYAIYSGMSYKEVINTLKVATESNCKFLYVSPERLETSLFKEYLPGMHVQLIAVDEAHCISQWGYDFRPPYLRIASLREELPGIPVLALTASATPDVQGDICAKLSHDSKTKWKIFRQSFERPNLSYSIFRVDSKINKIINVLSNVAGTAIVYCKSRRRTKEISELLKLQNVSSDFYHAGLTQEQRNRKQDDWINNKTRVIVCTNAFGMGIDKPDVRIVIHADIPDCLENYYQEAGRAGRDGKKSYAVLLYDEQDLEDLALIPATRFPSMDEIRKVYQAIVNYLQIPVGMHPGQEYDFDPLDFANRFKLDGYSFIYPLKTLEQDGWLSFNEQVFRPSTVTFNVTKDRLFAFEKENPRLEPLLKTLLRAYEGIFDHTVFISEPVIAQLLKSGADNIKLLLDEANKAGVIEYIPRKDTPQLVLLRNRVKAEELKIDAANYNVRKEKFLQRVRVMTQYVKEERKCRGQFIAAYFGDDNVKSCGICDNCLRMKSVTVSKEDFEKITVEIMGHLSEKALPVKELMQKLKDFKKEKAWKVIDFLQAENKIEVDGKGMVKLMRNLK